VQLEKPHSLQKKPDSDHYTLVFTVVIAIKVSLCTLYVQCAETHLDGGILSPFAFPLSVIA